MLAILRHKLQERHLSAEVHRADVTCLALGKRYDLIFIAFHSFSEIVEPAAQLRALRAIRAHLSDGGRFICTLHNPAHRIRSADGRKRLVAEAPVGDGLTLRLWGRVRYDAASATVTGQQIYETYDRDGARRSHLVLDVRFVLPSREDFARLAHQAGLRMAAIYGD